MIKGKKIMERFYKARNGVEEITRFFVSPLAKPRSPKSNSYTYRKQEANRNHAIHILGRLLNNNFDSNSYFVTLTYDDDHLYALHQSLKGNKDFHAEILDALDRDARNFIRRLRRAGIGEMSYVIVSSDMDGDTLEDKRPHIHIVLSGANLGKVNNYVVVNGKHLNDIWKMSPLVAARKLSDGSYSNLAAYLLRQARAIHYRRSYICSRNLERIIPEEYETDLPPSEPFDIPPGVEVEEWQLGDSSVELGLMQYIRYRYRSSKARLGEEVPNGVQKNSCFAEHGNETKK